MIFTSFCTEDNAHHLHVPVQLPTSPYSLYADFKYVLGQEKVSNLLVESEGSIEELRARATLANLISKVEDGTKETSHKGMSLRADMLQTCFEVLKEIAPPGILSKARFTKDVKKKFNSLLQDLVIHVVVASLLYATRQDMVAGEYSFADSTDPLVRDEKMAAWLLKRLDKLFAAVKSTFSDTDNASAIKSIEADTSNFVTRGHYLDYSEIAEYLNNFNNVQLVNLLMDVEEVVEEALDMTPGSGKGDLDGAKEKLQGVASGAIKEAAAWAGLKSLYGEPTGPYSSTAKRRLSLSRSVERKKRMQATAFSSPVRSPYALPGKSRSPVPRSQSRRQIFYDEETLSDDDLDLTQPQRDLADLHRQSVGESAQKGIPRRSSTGKSHDKVERFADSAFKITDQYEGILDEDGYRSDNETTYARCYGDRAGLEVKEVPFNYPERYHNIAAVPKAKGVKRMRFTQEEDEAIIEGLSHYMTTDWAAILNDDRYCEILKHRTTVNLKDRYRQLRKMDYDFTEFDDFQRTLQTDAFVNESFRNRRAWSRWARKSKAREALGIKAPPMPPKFKELKKRRRGERSDSEESDEEQDE